MLVLRTGNRSVRTGERRKEGKLNLKDMGWRPNHLGLSSQGLSVKDQAMSKAEGFARRGFPNRNLYYHLRIRMMTQGLVRLRLWSTLYMLQSPPPQYPKSQVSAFISRTARGGPWHMPTPLWLFSVQFSNTFPLWFLISRVPGAMRRSRCDILEISLLQEFMS